MLDYLDRFRQRLLQLAEQGFALLVAPIFEALQCLGELAIDRAQHLAAVLVCMVEPVDAFFRGHDLFGRHTAPASVKGSFPIVFAGNAAPVKQTGRGIEIPRPAALPSPSITRRGEADLPSPWSNAGAAAWVSR